MGQRHNRRRTRPRSRPRAASLDSLRSTTDSCRQTRHSVHDSPEPVILTPIAPTRHHWVKERYSSGFIINEPLHADQLQQQHRYRFFGGEPGDDEILCYNMLDFFGRLDYIDT